MPLKEPQSMTELAYFTNRTIDGCPVKAWVYRGDCPECKKAKMGKPVAKGKVKMRASEYVCPACEYTVEKEAYEDTLQLEAMYTCPHCKKKGEGTNSFERKKVSRFDVEKQKKVTADAVRIVCEHCGKNIDITKKMK